MNFFQQQDRARKKTSILVALLIIAVLVLIAITVVWVATSIYFLQANSDSVQAYQSQQLSFYQHLLVFANSKTTFYIALAVIAVVFTGSLIKLTQLKRGGRWVAESLGGRLLVKATATAKERVLLNVVEEMAIASGNPVPPVYVMDEDGINAFAAGFSRRDHVIGMTRGCINILSRDEIQGVIAHEFSHIHNGDMRLNMKLVAMLHGILFIGIIGYYILRSCSRTRSSRKGNGKIAIFGIVLVIIGYGGTFFGNIIKAAVSRQREFLADASAVQFTRNPAGVSGALKKIGGFSQGSILQSGAASEYSHMYFGQGIRSAFSSLMATHPPLGERIKRIEPRWNGLFPHVKDELAEEKKPGRAKAATVGMSGETGHAGAQPASRVDSDFVSQFSDTANDAVKEGAKEAALENADRSLIEDIGNPTKLHLDLAAQYLAALPLALVESVEDPFSARAVIYCLLLDTDRSKAAMQFESLKDKAYPATLSEVKRLYPLIKNISATLRLSIVNLCLPSLKQLSDTQRAVFKNNLVRLIKADEQVSFFEWCLYRIVTQNLEGKRYKERYKLKTLEYEIGVILSTVIFAGNAAISQHVYADCFEDLGRNVSVRISSEPYSYQKIDAALARLVELKPFEKTKLLKSIAKVIEVDGVVAVAEAELYRALADTLDCPVPLILPSGEKVA